MARTWRELWSVVMAKVTVLTPTYQHAAFVAACIRSVVAQTEADWEMVVVDDGSDDGTAEIAESFGDPRIVVLRREHQGVDGLGAAYASALERSASPFVAILEGDDMWPPTKLADQLTLFQDPSVVLAYGSAGLIDESGCVYARYRHAPRGDRGRNSPVGIILPDLVRVNFIVAATVMIRRSALDSVGGFIQPSDIPYVDHPTWLRLATIGTFARSAQVVGYWRRYRRQVTTRSWYGAIPDRAPYLRGALAEAGDAVPPTVLANAAAAIRYDQARQRQEARIARGRMALLDGRWSPAASIFRSVLRTGNRDIRVAAVLGLLCASCRTDMEWLIRAAGRHALPSRRHLATHILSVPAGGLNAEPGDK
jgi:glycosyltransferase involved in cell wall biosynthesis